MSDTEDNELVSRGLTIGLALTTNWSDAQLRALVEQVEDYAVFALDADGRVQTWNIGASKIKGYQADEIIGQPYSVFFTPQDVEAGVPDALLEKAKRLGHVRNEGRRVRRDGTLFWADAVLTALRDEAGNHIGFSKVTRDVTALQAEKLRARQYNADLERRVAERTADLERANAKLQAEVQTRSEAELRLSDRERQLAAVTLNSPDILCRFDRAMRHVFVSEAVEVATGYPPAHFIGKSNRELGMPDPLCALLERQLRAVFETGQPVEFDFDFLSPTGPRHYSCRLVAEPSVNGQIEHVLSATSDVTDRRRMEAELRSAKEAAESASRAKDAFLAALSHELRTPLTPVLLTVQMLERNPTLSQSVRDDLATIRRNVGIETRLIDDLLDLTRVSRGKLELKLRPTNLNELLLHTIDTCRDDLFAQKHLKLTTQMEASRHCVEADDARLGQVFWNLIKNAVKFSPESGTITIRSWNSGPSHIAISIADSGPGIAPDVLPVIFNAFEQGGPEVTRRFGGLGLGLTISRALTESHGGTLQARSEGVGCGATFIVELPTIEQTCDPQSNLAGATPLKEARLRSRQLLLVEDHKETATAMCRLLRLLGYDVHWAHSVASAIAIASGSTFDLVISDLGLPDGTGHELMSQLHKKHRLNGIALTGFGMESDVAQSTASGFLRHLVKPVDVQMLEKTIREILEPGPIV